MADEYAKIGTTDTNNCYPTHLTKTNINQLVEDYIYKEWKIAWQTQPGCKHTKYFYPSPSKTKHKETNRLARSQLNLLIQITTGQNKLNYLTHKINPLVSELCRYCEEEDETYIHLLSECPVFIQDRLDIFNLRAFNELSEWKPEQLIKFAKIPIIYEALTEDADYGRERGVW